MPIVKWSVMDKLLTIAIPTYNRADKVKRLLSVIKDEIVSSRLRDQVAVIVSNNASTDNTHSAVSEFVNCGLNLQYYRQPENLGFGGNVRFLYMKASTEYFWIMGDDDLPLKGAIAKVVKTLEMYNPDIVLFSFIQPPGSTFRQFDYPEPVRLVSDPVLAIEHVLRYIKVSIYVMRKISIDSLQWQVLDKIRGGNWYYILLAFSVLEASSNLQLAVISEPLAMCDEDYYVISTDPYDLLQMKTSVEHPFVLKHSPGLFRFYKDKGYYTAIQFAYAVKIGSLSPEYPEEYDKFIRELECRFYTLLRRPRSLIQFMALKLRIAWLSPKIRPVVRWIKPLSVSRNNRVAVW